MLTLHKPVRSFGNRRRYRRIEADLQLILISVTSRIDGVLRDLSQSGARVSLRQTPPPRGRDVLLRWGSQEFFGHVVWSSGTDAGIAFHKLISPEDLAETLGGEIPLFTPQARQVL